MRGMNKGLMKRNLKISEQWQAGKKSYEDLAKMYELGEVRVRQICRHVEQMQGQPKARATRTRRKKR